MRCRLALCALAGALLAQAAAAPVNAAILVTVDKSSQQMIVAVDGERRFTWPVSTGKTGYATPSGAWTAFRMEEDHYSQEWDDAPMPHSIFFTKDGHAIHGSFETKRLGMPASHGCVRLSPAHAAALFALVRREGLANTKVVLTGSEQVALARRKEELARKGDVASRDKREAAARREVARRNLNPPAGYALGDAMPPAYAEGDESYGQPRYLAPRYVQPQYVQPQYVQPQYVQPQYAEPQYVQPQYAEPQYAQPRYVQPGYGYGRRGYSDGW